MRKLSALLGFGLIAETFVSPAMAAGLGSPVLSVVAPYNGAISATDKTDVVVDAPASAHLRLLVNGVASSITPSEASQTALSDRYTFKNVAIASGSNTIRVADADAANADVSLKVFGPGEMEKASVVSTTPLRSTGVTTDVVRVALRDRFDKPALAGAYVKAKILQGDAHFVVPVNATPPPAVAYANAPVSTDKEAYVLVDDSGNIEIPLAPGTRNGPLQIALIGGDVERDLNLGLLPNTRQPLVVGYVTGGIGSVPGLPDEPDNAPDGTTSRRGAVSLYGTGQIAKNTSGTFAYYSADVLEQAINAGPFIDNPNDRPFPIYGDTSVRTDDALSQDHFFARIENGNDYLMWGQYQANAAPTGAVGGYNELVDGAKARFGGNALTVSPFLAKNNIAFDREVISPTGLAIVANTLHPDIVVGSDVITLVHLDRRTGAILEQQTLQRGVDYTLDYASGMLTFINIILPYDDDFNPQQIVVQYEYGGIGAQTRTVGGTASLKLTPDGQNHMDWWYVNDTTGTGNLTLLGQNFQGTLKGGNWQVSHEQSSGYLPVSQVFYGNGGDAFSGSLNTTAGALKLSLNYSDTTPGYNNPYGAYATPGLMSFVAGVTDKISQKAELAFQYMTAANALPETPASQAVQNNMEVGSVKLKVAADKRFKYHIGVQESSSSSNGVENPAFIGSGNFTSPSAPTVYPGFSGGLAPSIPGVGAPLTEYFAGSGHGMDVDTGFDWGITRNATISVDRLSQLGSSIDPYNPPETTAQIAVNTGGGSQAFLRQLWLNSSVQPLAATQTDATYDATARTSTMLGFEQTIGNSTWDTGYSVDHTISGTDLYEATGVRQTIKASQYLSGDGFLQVGQALIPTVEPTTGPSSPFFMVLGGSLNYARDTFHATGQFQTRTGYAGGSTYQLAATGAISPDVSLYGSDTGAYSQGVQDNETLFGLSYRPSTNDRAVTLVSVDSHTGNITDYDAYVTNVAQVQELYRLSDYTEVAGSLAYKLTGDQYFQPHTAIWGVRVDQRLTDRVDIGSELHISTIAPVDYSKDTGFAVEAGYRIGSPMRLAFGYNFSGFADPSTATSPTHRGLYVTLSSYVDRIFGWGKDTH
jgi:hypothetical protein